MDLDQALQQFPSLTLRAYQVPPEVILRHRWAIEKALYVPFEVGQLLKEQDPENPCYLQALNLSPDQALELGAITNLAYPLEALWQAGQLEALLRRSALYAKDAYDLRQLTSPAWDNLAHLEATHPELYQLDLDHLPYLKPQTIERLAIADHPQTNLVIYSKQVMFHTYLMILEGRSPTPVEVSTIRSQPHALAAYARYSRLDHPVLLEEVMHYFPDQTLLNPHFHPPLEVFKDTLHPWALRHPHLSDQKGLLQWAGPQDNLDHQNPHSLSRYQQYFDQHPNPHCDGLFMLHLSFGLAGQEYNGIYYPHRGFLRYGPKEAIPQGITHPYRGDTPEVLALRDDIDHGSILEHLLTT